MRKPLGHKGFLKERATGVEPATSSLGNEKDEVEEARENERKSCNVEKLRVGGHIPH